MVQKAIQKTLQAREAFCDALQTSFKSCQVKLFPLLCQRGQENVETPHCNRPCETRPGDFYCPTAIWTSLAILDHSIILPCWGVPPRIHENNDAFVSHVRSACGKRLILFKAVSEFLYLLLFGVIFLKYRHFA